MCGFRILIVMLVCLASVACTGDPIPRQVARGGSLALNLVDRFDTTQIGYASTLGGPDPQRGGPVFVLCPVGMSTCSRSDGQPLETALVTRARNDEAAADATGSTFVAILNVPLDAVPGIHTLLGFQIDPSGAERPLFPAGLERSIQVLDVVGEPTLLVDPGDVQQEQSVAAMVPRPTLQLEQQVTPPAPTALAASIRLRFPAAKLSLKGVVPARDTPATPDYLEMFVTGPDTVEILIAASAGATAPALIFELQPGATPVVAGEFQILDQVFYDANGLRSPRTPFRIKGIL